MKIKCSEMLEAVMLSETTVDEVIEMIQTANPSITTYYKIIADNDGVKIVQNSGQDSNGNTIYETIKAYNFGQYCVSSYMAQNVIAFSGDEFASRFVCYTNNPYYNVPDAQVKLQNSCN